MWNTIPVPDQRSHPVFSIKLCHNITDNYDMPRSVKYSYLSIIAFVIFHCNLIANDSFPDRHVVLDIDWTITAEVDPKSNGNRVFEVEGKKYYLNDGVENLLSELLEMKGMHISFYSGGLRSRNLALLEKIRLKNGKNAREMAYKILSRDDLIKVDGSSHDAEFATRFKKDLRKVSEDLSQIILIDDHKDFILNSSQTNNMFWKGKVFSHFDNFGMTKVSNNVEYTPKNLEEWSFDRKKMMIITGALIEADKNFKKSHNWIGEIKKQSIKLNFQDLKWNDYSKKMYAMAIKKEKLLNSCPNLYKNIANKR